MSTVYNPNPANPPQGALAVTIPADGDALAAASVITPFQSGADFAEMIYEQLQAIVVSAWTKQTSGTSQPLWDCASKKVLTGTLANYIVVGQASVAPPLVLTSPDGIFWTIGSGVGTLTTLNAVGVNAAGTLAVGVGIGASGQNVMTSPDGTTWTLRTLGVATGVQTQPGVVWSPSLSLWALSTGNAGGAGGIYTSPDGITWTSRTVGAGTDAINKIVWVPGLALFVVCGYVIATGAVEVWTSSDGTTWTLRAIPTGGTAQSIGIAASSASLLMVISKTTETWTSPDAITWTKKTSTGGFASGAVIHTGRQWLIAQASGSLVWFYSSIDNGTTWKARKIGSPNFSSMTASATGELLLLSFTGGIFLSGTSALV